VSDFDNFDLIYVMDESNYRNLIQLARNDQDKRKIKFIMDEVYPNQNYNVPDPYYGGNDGFESVFNMLDEACTLIAAKLQ
jgi:protein-tyrosine phosphatase